MEQRTFVTMESIVSLVRKLKVMQDKKTLKSLGLLQSLALNQRCLLDKLVRPFRPVDQNRLQ